MKCLISIHQTPLELVQPKALAVPILHTSPFLPSIRTNVNYALNLAKEAVGVSRNHPADAAQDRSRLRQFHQISFRGCSLDITNYDQCGGMDADV